MRRGDRLEEEEEVDGEEDAYRGGEGRHGRQAPAQRAAVAPVAGPPKHQSASLAFTETTTCYATTCLHYVMQGSGLLPN